MWCTANINFHTILIVILTCRGLLMLPTTAYFSNLGSQVARKLVSQRPTWLSCLKTKITPETQVSKRDLSSRAEHVRAKAKHEDLVKRWSLLSSNTLFSSSNCEKTSVIQWRVIMINQMKVVTEANQNKGNITTIHWELKANSDTSDWTSNAGKRVSQEQF